MEEDQIKKMSALRDRCSLFLKDVSAPIKKQHIGDIEKYLERFIAFPGAISIVSIFFPSSELVKNHTLAIIGTLTIIISLLVALNIFRRQINTDKIFYKKIFEIEKPMVDFSAKLTQFGRGETAEPQLLESYNNLQKSYTKNSGNLNNKDIDLNKKIDFVYTQINISFFLLIVGLLFCFVSTFGKIK
jgi:hypothetical protein